MFKKILIANRGEIAVRVIRACREMGIIPAVIYSAADRRALHVRLAEEAYDIGEAKPSESYLNIEKILDVAKRCGAEAIHPGYGFLAENSRFVKRCEEEGIVFIGPPSRPMEIMGEKTSSRRVMREAGVPIIPGTLDSIKDEADLKKRAHEVGFPLLLKASAGGGGKGLRLVKNKGDLPPAFKLAQSEALSSFGDSAIYIEKYIKEPHHIEIQILADHHGRVVYLGERECSMQRRYQKVLEETPSPFLDDRTRQAMGETAVKAAASIGYRNAGTVEFVVDRERNFFFLEMNARLQVEHPITEMVTGIDLVKCQLEIAAGRPLPFRQEEIKPQGFSLECRIMAEDPFSDFMPSPGKAIRRMLRALAEYQVYGIKTTIPFFKRILLHPQFMAGRYNTHFIAELEKESDRESPEEETAALIAAGIKSYRDAQVEVGPQAKGKESPWKIQGRLENLVSRL
jgi:acetyl-CoA carboxylase biotin carboxylase subunit